MTKKAVNHRTKPRTTPLMAKLESRLTLDATQFRTMALNPYIAIDAISRLKDWQAAPDMLSRVSAGELEEVGTAAFGVLCQYAVFADAMCEQGAGKEFRSVIDAGHDAMRRLGTRAKNGGQWAFAGDEYRAICNLLGAYCEQLQASSVNDIVKAHATLLNTMKERKQTDEQMLKMAA